MLNQKRPGTRHRLLCLRGRLVLVLATVFSFMKQTLVAQETFVQPPAKLVTTFPFTVFTGGVILVRATMDNFPDSLNFILDTGSGGISLDSATCEQLKLKPIPSDKTILGIAGIRPVKFLYDRTLHLPNLTVDSLNFHVSDYDILTQVYGARID